MWGKRNTSTNEINRNVSYTSGSIDLTIIFFDRIMYLLVRFAYLTQKSISKLLVILKDIYSSHSFCTTTFYFSFKDINSLHGKKCGLENRESYVY